MSRLSDGAPRLRADGKGRGIVDVQAGLHATVDESLEPRAAEINLPPVLKSRFLRHLSFHAVYQVDDQYILGEGMAGAVLRAVHRRSGRFVAAKLLKCSQGEVPEEATLYLRLSHPNICRLLQAFLEENGDLWLCMEYCSGGELFEQVAGTSRIVRQGGSLWDTEAHIAFLAQQMASALRYLHSMGIVHRDIKLENWVFASSKQARIKLIDFGLAASVISASDEVARSTSSMPTTRTLTKTCGSCYYVAPEVFEVSEEGLVEGTGYGKEVDIWALGVVLYMLISGKAPFDGRNQAAILFKVASLRHCDDFLCDAFTGHRWQNVSTKCKDLIARCLERDPGKRLTAARVQMHPWILEGARVNATVPRSLATILGDLHSAGRKMASCLPLAYLCGYLASTIYLAPELWSSLKADFAASEASEMIAPRGALVVESLVLAYGQSVDSGHVVAPSMHTSMPHTEFSDAYFRFLDLTGDGRLHFFEFLGAMIAAGYVAVHDYDVADAFAAFDLDMDGAVSYVDWSVLFGDRTEHFHHNLGTLELPFPIKEPQVLLTALRRAEPNAERNESLQHKVQAPTSSPRRDVKGTTTERLLTKAQLGLDWKVHRQFGFEDAKNAVGDACLRSLRRGWRTPDPSPTRHRHQDAMNCPHERPTRHNLRRGHRTPDPSPSRSGDGKLVENA